MNAAKPSPAVRFLPSLGDVAFWLPVVLLFAKLDGARTLLGDGDTGWHIRAGEWILANGRVPDRDIFSFTKAGEPWFAWEWLWDVLFAWLHQRAGMAAVVLASVILLSATCALLYSLIRRRCRNALIAFAVTFLAVAASSIHWLARPHLVTLLGIVVFCQVLESAREGRTRLLAWLPLLMVLWTNLHGGFFVGIVLCLTYGAGEAVAWLLEADPDARRAALARSKPYVAAAAGCLVASFVNPYFFELHLHILRYLNDPFQFEHIIEFLPLNFHEMGARYFEFLLLAGWLAAGWSAYRRRYADCLVLLSWGHLGLVSSRNAPLYAILAAPVVAEGAQRLLELAAGCKLRSWIREAAHGFQTFGAELGEMERVPRVRLASAAAVGLLIFVFYIPLRPPKLQAEYDPERYPAKALEVIEARGGRIFTNDEWGDYLIYRLYPKVKVFVDGRSDFYGAKFDKQYLSVMQGKYDWEQTLSRYAIDTVLLPVEASLASTLKHARRWQVIYDDGVAIVFRSNASQARLAETGPAAPEQISVVTDSGLGRAHTMAARQGRDQRITQSSYSRR